MKKQQTNVGFVTTC